MSIELFPVSGFPRIFHATKPRRRDAFSAAAATSRARRRMLRYTKSLYNTTTTTGHYAFTTLSCNCRARELLRARESRARREIAGHEALCPTRRSLDTTLYISMSMFFVSCFRSRSARTNRASRQSSDSPNISIRYKNNIRYEGNIARAQVERIKSSPRYILLRILRIMSQ